MMPGAESSPASPAGQEAQELLLLWGYVSLRNREKGSRMIEAMDEVFSEQGMKWHIGDLFTKINNNLMHETFSVHGCPVKETIVVESTLTKAVYLAP
ncbi:hypothetical protein UY3_17437 [Chelonia mydas]|uniref:Caspase family p10 domain-containing protein n=1 Tax=Chelonia mydas TaxID=8469 RepID=M7ARL3_CHEMY|nr:hypothetical protein UY3_17437 [Chelonia mydas]